jgi:hypothetical protein
MESYIKSTYVAISIYLEERKVPPILDMYHVQRNINRKSNKIKLRTEIPEQINKFHEDVQI